KRCRESDCAVLTFPKSTYRFRPDKALELHTYISNHDEGGLRRIAFPLFDFRRLTLDGQGSDFIFHGPMIPFMLENCDQVTLKNFSIDWDRPMFEQGVVVETSRDSFDLQLSADVEYRMHLGQLIF